LGSGMVMTGDVFFQVLSAAPPTLRDYLRVGQFQTLIAERTVDFVGRDFLFNSIDGYLSNGSSPDFPSGYIVIRGEPGIGKTSIAAQLVQRHGYLHHFNIATQNIRTAAEFLGNVCAQLILRFKLQHDALPPQATQDSGFLSQLLKEAADSQELPIVLVIDALDEADDIGLSANVNRLMLPPSLPNGVFVIITTRTKEEYRLSVHHRRDIYLDDNSDQNLADIRQYIVNFTTNFRSAMTERLAVWKTSETEFIDVITGKSQGNFMYLVHVLRDIREGRLTPGNLNSIYDLPLGLREYYQRHWRCMREQDPVRFHDYFEPVVCVLASAQEPIPLSQLVSWTKQQWPHLEQSNIREVIRVWREFLDEDKPPHGPPLFRIYHASFQDFLREEVGLREYHSAIATSALDKIPGFSAQFP